MLSVLPESRHVRRRATTSLVISAAVHVGIIAVAVDASTAEPPRRLTEVPDSIVYFPPPGEEPKLPERRTPDVGRVVPPDDWLPPPSLPQDVTVDPGIIPDRIPGSDVPLGPVFAPDSTRVSALGVRTGRPIGSDSATPLPNEYADKRALALEGNPPPRYPEMLRTAGVSGAVTMRFVIDTTGRVIIRTAEVRRSDHELFSAAVLAVLPRMRFLPAEANGRRVRVLAEQRFEFKLER